MAGTFNITIEQGATFRLPITIADTVDGVTTNRDLTGYTARMKIKESVEDTAALVTLTTSNGGITIDPDQVTNKGKLSLLISATDTAALDFDQGVYDLELVTGSEVERDLKGRVRLSREVTD
jgi:hypothetical protein